VTNYTPEQRAILARLGGASLRIRETIGAQRNEHVAAAGGITEAAAALAAAIERSDRLWPLFVEYVDTFQELVDSL
jgi:hypothetical protein